jgi:hypothetical protein
METLKHLVEEALEHEELLTWLFGALATVASIIALKLGWSAPKHWAWEYVTRAMEALKIAVKAVHQTYVEEVKRGKLATSPGGATLTADEKATAKRMAIERAKAMLGGTKMLNVALWIMKFRGGVDPWFESVLEATVHDTKGAPAVVVASPPAQATAAGASPSP